MSDTLALPRRAFLRAAALTGAGAGLASAMPAWAQPASSGLVRPLPTVSGTDIALSNTIAREIICSGLTNAEFIEHATSGFDQYRELVMPWTLDRGARETGVPAAVIREMAHTYATAKRAIICWTLGITEHHTAVHNVLALINLALLTGHVGRWGSGLNPLRGQNNVQGGGDMGALPDRLPGFQHVENEDVRKKFDRAWGVAVPPHKGWHLSDMFHAMEDGGLRALYVIGENPVQSEADQHKAVRLLQRLDCLVVQDLFLTGTAQIADVVLPKSSALSCTAGRIAAVFAALRNGWPARRLVVIFQPHRYCRTRDWVDDFAIVFSTGDILVLLEVYAAGETPLPGYDSRALARAVRTRGRVDPVLVEKAGDLPSVLPPLFRDGDLLLTLGAGAIGLVAARLPSQLRQDT